MFTLRLVRGLYQWESQPNNVNQVRHRLGSSRLVAYRQRDDHTVLILSSLDQEKQQVLLKRHQPKLFPVGVPVPGNSNRQYLAQTKESNSTMVMYSQEADCSKDRISWPSLGNRLSRLLGT